MQKAVAADMSP